MTAPVDDAEASLSRAVHLVPGHRPNSQKFVPNIYKAVAADYVPATQRVYCSPARPSHLVLPVVR
ncbi:MAG TPA: hypothetical protein VIX35_14370 [Vicinamibacterales bacterium]